MGFTLKVARPPTPKDNNPIFLMYDWATPFRSPPRSENLDRSYGSRMGGQPYANLHRRPSGFFFWAGPGTQMVSIGSGYARLLISRPTCTQSGYGRQSNLTYDCKLGFVFRWKGEIELLPSFRFFINWEIVRAFRFGK